MLVKHKEGHSNIIKGISIILICLFLFTDSSFALAPKLHLSKPEFEDAYLVKSILLSHDAVRRYIDSNINPKLAHTFLMDPLIDVRGVRGLLKNTGQIAQIAVDTLNRENVIFVDTNYFYNETVLGFEAEKLRALLALMKLKIQTNDAFDMAGWVAEHIDKPDPDIDNLNSRQWADKINADAQAKHPGIKRLYDRIKSKYRSAADRSDADRAESLINFAQMYRFYQDAGYLLDKDDPANINFAAHLAAPDEIAASSAAEVSQGTPPRSWIKDSAPELSDKIIVSISMEGNIPEFEGYAAQDANTRGGLGAYFGDKLEGLADIGAKGFGIQPGYSHVIHDGVSTKIDYKQLIDRNILQPVFVGNNAIEVRAWNEDPVANHARHADDINNPKIPVEVYRVNRGGTWDYILMSEVFDVLYPDEKTHGASGRIHRFTQEAVFGKAVYQLIKKLNINPDILHLNEAHTVVAAAQMRADPTFDKCAIVYTNHTIVPAGLESFSPESLRTDAARMMYVIGLPAEEAPKFRSRFLRPDGVVDFCYAATRLADVINAVSEEHAMATIKLFKNMYGEEFKVKVIGVLNGSGRSWKSKKLIEIEDSGRIPNMEELFEIHESGKDEAFEEVEKRTGIALDRNKLTMWAARRMADYKSQYPMLRFLAHILTADTTRSFSRDELKNIWFRDISDLKWDYNRELVESVLDKIFKEGKRERVNGIGMQIVVSAPDPIPQGVETFWASEFTRWSNQLPDLKGRFVYVPRSDARFLKMQAIGADICINMPRPLEEACGTSDQRSGRNGGVNMAVNGAGPKEWIKDYEEDPEDGCGLLIGSYTRRTDEGFEADIPRFYREAPADIFEKCRVASNLFYLPGKNDWKRIMHNAYLRSNSDEGVTAKAMEIRYARKIYSTAISARSDAVKTRLSESLPDEARLGSRIAPELIGECPDRDEILSIVDGLGKDDTAQRFRRLAQIGLSDISNLYAILFSLRDDNALDALSGAISEAENASDTVKMSALSDIRNFRLDYSKKPTQIVCQLPLKLITGSLKSPGQVYKMIEDLALPAGSIDYLVGVLAHGKMSDKINTNDIEADGEYRGHYACVAKGSDGKDATVIVKGCVSSNVEEIRKGWRSGCPFSVSDPSMVDPDIGTMDEFKKFVASLHGRGQNAIIDFVGSLAVDSPIVIDHPEWMKSRLVKEGPSDISDLQLLEQNPDKFLLVKDGQRWLIEHNRDWIARSPSWIDTAMPDWDNKDFRDYMLSSIKKWAGIVDGMRVDMAHLIPAEFRAEALKMARSINPRFIMIEEVYHHLEEGSRSLGAVPYGKYLYDWIRQPKNLNAYLGGYFRTDHAYLKQVLHFAENHDDVIANTAFPNVSWLIAATVGGYYMFDAMHVFYDPAAHYPPQATHKRWLEELKGQENMDRVKFQKRLLKILQHKAFESASRRIFYPTKPNVIAYCAGTGESQAIIVANISGHDTRDALNIDISKFPKSEYYLLYDAIADLFYVASNEELQRTYIELKRDQAHVFFIKAIEPIAGDKWDDIVARRHENAFLPEEIASFIKNRDCLKDLEYMFDKPHDIGANAVTLMHDRGKGSPADCLETIKDDNELMRKALDRKTGISVAEVAQLRGFPIDTVRKEFRILTELGIFKRMYKPGRFRFSDYMMGPDINKPDADYTKSLINVINDIDYQIGKKGETRPLHRADITYFKSSLVRHLIRMSVINEVNKEISAPEGKVSWHLIEEGVIPAQQRSAIVTQINKISRDTNASERIWILKKSESIEEAINKIREDDPRAIIDVALSSRTHIKSVPDDRSVKMLVFKSGGSEFIQLEGVIAALRALHSDDALERLLRIYTVMTGRSYFNPPRNISEDPKEFALRFVFDLPPAKRILVKDLPKLNKRLLEFLTAA